MSYTLTRLDEPVLMFGYNQATEDPRDGLTLFGPLDDGKPYGVRAGIVGSSTAIERMSRWVHSIQSPVLSVQAKKFEADGEWEGLQRWERARPSFPGFETVFGIPWKPTPTLALEVPDDELRAALFLDDPA